MIFMGIDGGGSTLRVVIVDAQMNVLVQVKRGTANPSLIGREAATTHIQDTMRAALTEADNPPIAAVGIGIAGASAEYAQDWLHAVVSDVLPSAHIAAASDNEIALVGALAQRQGILVLSGTGSGAFGVNAAGTALQVGGWGYLLGDEGSGYWIGLQALKHVTHSFDAGTSDPLSERILRTLSLQNGRQVIAAVYQAGRPIPTIAQLAPVVLELAADGVASAQSIAAAAARHLTEQAQTVMTRLQMPTPRIAFAGSILEHDNAVSEGLRQALQLHEKPQARYAPVIGAALLAQLSLDATN